MCEKCVDKGGNFGKKLFKFLAKTKSVLITSPFSLQMVLSMLYVGTAGDTATALRKVMGLKDVVTTSAICNAFLTDIEKVKSVTVSVANKIYVQTGFEIKTAYKNAIRDTFLSEVEEMNFADSDNSSRTINEWIETKTNSKIKELIGPDDLNDSTRLVLLNAVYFKGNWARKFDRANTKKATFYLQNGNTKEVDMMFITAPYRFAESVTLRATILEMPYVGAEFSMLILLPNDKNGIKHLKNSLDKFDSSNLEMTEFNLMVGLPKFTIESKIHLEDPLAALGLSAIFSDSANFSEISETPGLVVNKIVQKAFVEVNEEGTEAAAATGATMMLKSLPPSFIADHEFIFLIKYKDIILFIGAYS